MAVEDAGKVAIMYTANPDDVPEYFQRGFQAVTLSTDIKLMIVSLSQKVKQAKQS